MVKVDDSGIKSLATTTPVIEENPELISTGTNNMDSKSTDFNRYIKWISLFLMTTQNASVYVTMRMSRSQSKDLYISTTAVILQEIFKLMACVALVIHEEGGIRGCLRVLNNHIIQQPLSTLKVAVPSFTYVLQNNLMYLAITHLSAAIYQVTYQSKIFTTGVFSVIMLKRKLSFIQWLALSVLFVGVCIVQLEQQLGSVKIEKSEVKQQPILGLAACVFASVISGFSGVYIEKVVKSSTDVSVWVRNIQMIIIAIPIAVIIMMVQHGDQVRELGFFYGYNTLVWAVVLNHAFGGLLVAVVIKYADNILKGFATSLSIILSCIASVYLFDFSLTFIFIIGTALVLSSIFLYGQPTSLIRFLRLN